MPDKKTLKEAGMAGLKMAQIEKIGREGLKRAGGETGKQKPPVEEKQVQKMDPPKPEMKYGKGPHMGHSPNEMGHSPAEMESAKQEKYNLMHDNPVAKDASGGRPWIARHFKSSMGSPAKMGHSPMEKHSKAQEKGLNPGLVSAIHLHDDFTKKITLNTNNSRDLQNPSQTTKITKTKTTTKWQNLLNLTFKTAVMA